MKNKGDDIWERRGNSQTDLEGMVLSLCEFPCSAHFHSKSFLEGTGVKWFGILMAALSNKVTGALNGSRGVEEAMGARFLL